MLAAPFQDNFVSSFVPLFPPDIRSNSNPPNALLARFTPWVGGKVDYHLPELSIWGWEAVADTKYETCLSTRSLISLQFPPMPVLMAVLSPSSKNPSINTATLYIFISF